MTPTLTSCAEAACVMATPAKAAAAAIVAIFRWDIKILPDFPNFGRFQCRAKAQNGASEVRLRRCGPPSRNAGALWLRRGKRLTRGHFHDGLDSDRDRRPCPECRLAGAVRVGAHIRRGGAATVRRSTQEDQRLDRRPGQIG